MATYHIYRIVKPARGLVSSVLRPLGTVEAFDPFTAVERARHDQDIPHADRRKIVAWLNPAPASRLEKAKAG